MKKSRLSEEQIAYALRMAGGRREPSDWHLRGHVLHIEEEAR